MASAAPWRSHVYDGPLSTRQLREWRNLAEKLARRHGAKHACQICKRPCNRRGMAEVRAPLGRARRQRSICYGCWLDLTAYIEYLEATKHLDHLPVEQLDFGEELA